MAAAPPDSRLYPEWWTEDDLANELDKNMLVVVRYKKDPKAKLPPPDAFRFCKGVIEATPEKAEQIAVAINVAFVKHRKEDGWYYITRHNNCYNVFVRLW